MSRLSRDIVRERGERASAARRGGSDSHSELATIIDQSAAGAPQFSDFLRRLECRGVTPLPSINVRGLNGMSYRFRGETFKGSDIGRAYTAQGLQDRKGVQYSAERDLPSIQTATQERTAGGRTRDVRTGISADQAATLAEVGKFRTLNVQDLIVHLYEGKYAPLSQDVRVLREAGLIERRTAVHAKSGKSYDVIVLTPKGRRAARTAANLEGSAQQFYSGLVKSAEIRHDIGIYRMYQRERGEIEAAGGRITRVAMDFEIKKRLMSELNRRGEDPRDQQRKAAIAIRHDIEIVNGRFIIPDLRVEYQTRDRESKHVNLELATGDYKPAQIAAKRAAGLKIYGLDSRPGGAPWDPDYASTVISL